MNNDIGELIAVVRDGKITYTEEYTEYQLASQFLKEEPKAYDAFVEDLEDPEQIDELFTIIPFYEHETMVGVGT